MKKPNFLNKPIPSALGIALLAFLVRFAFIAFYNAHPLAGGDPTAFWSFAEGIASGRGFRSTFEPWLADRPPLYSYFLAGIFLLGGRNQQVVFLVQALLASISSAIFYLSITQWLSRFGSLVSGILFALFPSILLFTQQILTEAIYIPVWIFLLACLLFLQDKPDSKLLVLGTGIFLGLLTLVRREALLPGSILVVGLLWINTHQQWKVVLQRGAIIFMTAGLVVLPWLLRNYYALGTPVLSSSGGVNFMVGNNPIANGAYSPPPAEWQAQLQGLTELERDQKAWELSLHWIQQKPKDFMHLLPKKLFVLWGPSHNFALDLADILLITLCLPGIIRLLLRREQWKEVTLISFTSVLTTTLIGLIFVGAWRYRLIVYPGLIFFAGYGVMELSSWYESIEKRIYQRLHGTAIS